MKKYLTSIFLISLYIYLNSSYSLGSYISCGGVSVPTELGSITRIIILLLQIVAPLGLIILGGIDFIKAVTAGNDSDIKKKQQVFVKRLIYGALLFFVITLVQFVINVAADNASEKDFTRCLRCMTTTDDSCDGEVSDPYDYEYPEQGEVFEPEVETPPKVEYDENGEKIDKED
ncbi:MAG: hypothetical protein SOZ95_06205 [Bacilli bacterium]|nr:hypothetical protein [Bacilli bacterium]